MPTAARATVVRSFTEKAVTQKPHRRTNSGENEGGSAADWLHARSAGRLIKPANKKAGARPAFSQIETFQLRLRSVFRDHRATPAVVDARGDHIDVLTDAVDTRIYADRGKNGREADVTSAHEQMIVFDCSRPVRGESKFKTSSNCTAPAGFSGAVKHHAGIQTLVLVVGDGGAALHIPKNVVPGIADLACEQAQRIDFGSVNKRSKNAARIRSTQISPVALGFDTEHPSAALPTVTNLSADDPAGCVVTAFRGGRNRSPEGACRSPAVAARPPAAVGADVETAPVIDRSDHRRRLGIRTGREIGG